MADQVTMPLHALLMKVAGAGGGRVLLDGISSLQAERAEETGTDGTAGTRPVTSSLAWLVLADLLADNGWQDGAPGLLCLCIPRAQSARPNARHLLLQSFFGAWCSRLRRLLSLGEWHIAPVMCRPDFIFRWSARLLATGTGRFRRKRLDVLVEGVCNTFAKSTSAEDAGSSWTFL